MGEEGREVVEDQSGPSGGAPGEAGTARRPSVWEFVRAQMSLPGLEAWSNSTRTVLINALFLITVVVVLPVFIAQFRRGEVVIEPIAVPQALIDQGLTADVAASRLWDGMKEVETRAGTAKVSIDAIPSAQKVEFSFPDSGISIESLVFHVRRLFNVYETRVAGEITCADPACARSGMQLRLRVIRNGVDVVDLPPMRGETERSYFADAAEGVLSHLDPFVAMASMSHDRPVEAIALAYRHIRAKHPDSKWFYDQVGRIHADDGEMGKAIEEFRAAIELDRNFLQAHAALAEALFRSNDAKGAAAELDFVRLRDPNNAAMLHTSARMALAQGDADGAVKLLLQAANARPEDPQFLSEAGAIELDRGRKAEGEALLRQALQLDPGYPLAFVSLAAPHVISGDYAAAAKIYRNAADFNPDDPKPQASYANMLALLHDWPNALARFSRALELDPANTAYAVQVAKCLQALERNDEALAMLQPLRDREPANPQVVLTVADSLRALQRKPEAIAAYKRFLDLDKEDAASRTMAEAWIRNLSG